MPHTQVPFPISRMRSNTREDVSAGVGESELLADLSAVFVGNLRSFINTKVFLYDGVHEFHASKKIQNGAPVYMAGPDEWIFAGDDGSWYLNDGDAEFSHRMKGPRMWVSGVPGTTSVFPPSGKSSWDLCLMPGKSIRTREIVFDDEFMESLKRGMYN